MAKVGHDYKKGRVFLRGLTSNEYDISEFRSRQFDADPLRSDDSLDVAAIERAHSRWRIGPGDDPFLTQSIQVHISFQPPGSSNRGHGHQNDAAFYVLRGHGYDVHDEVRYDWQTGDLLLVHPDSVHRHFNESDEIAASLVFKAKTTSMMLGLVQQGSAYDASDPEGYGERQDWSRLWTPGVQERHKLVRASTMDWTQTPDGYIKRLLDETTGGRTFSVDVYEQLIPSGGSSSKHWHMADEVAHALEGDGYCLQWDVAAEIEHRYYARIALTPRRIDFQEGDTVYTPTNVVNQYFSADGSEQLRILIGQNRMYKHLGYENTVRFEEASS